MMRPPSGPAGLRAAATLLLLAAAAPAAAAPAADLRVAGLAAGCGACHAAAAAPDAAIPGLRGRPPAEIAAAVRAYRNGTRPNALMAAAVAGFDDATVEALAAYLSAGGEGAR